MADCEEVADRLYRLPPNVCTAAARRWWPRPRPGGPAVVAGAGTRAGGAVRRAEERSEPARRSADELARRERRARQARRRAEEELRRAGDHLVECPAGTGTPAAVPTRRHGRPEGDVAG